MFSQIAIFGVMTNCIFCRIVKGEIPTPKVYEDDNFLAFLDMHPLNRGHTLVIPKKHVRWVQDVQPFGKYWETALKVTNGIMNGLKADRVQYITVGEVVLHAHIHVVPRYEGDGHPDLPDWSKDKKFTEEEFENTVKVIKEAIKI